MSTSFADVCDRTGERRFVRIVICEDAKFSEELGRYLQARGFAFLRRQPGPIFGHPPAVTLELYVLPIDLAALVGAINRAARDGLESTIQFAPIPQVIVRRASARASFSAHEWVPFLDLLPAPESSPNSGHSAC
jgi:hypothetical protein